MVLVISDAKRFLVGCVSGKTVSLVGLSERERSFVCVEQGYVRQLHQSNE